MNTATAPQGRSATEIKDTEISAALSENVYPMSKLLEIWSSVGGTSLAVCIIFDDDTLLLARDNDPRPVKNKEGEVVALHRPGWGAYKCSFGYRGTPETVLNEGGPADRALFGTLSSRASSLERAEYFYRESGDGWAVITIPYYFSGSKMEWLSDINTAAWSEFKSKTPWTYDFKALPRTLCFVKDSKGVPAVYDDSKYVRVTFERTTYTLWDEQQFRDQTLPLLKRFE